MMAGADGISEMTRQWAHVLESWVKEDGGRLEIWSLDDDGRPDDSTHSTQFQTARGSRIRFASFGVADGIGSATDTLVIVMHLQLLPVALPLVWRGGRLLQILMGIEAWVPLRPHQRSALRRAWKVASISTHTAARFRAANPSLADMAITVCPPGAPQLPNASADRVEGLYALIVGRMSSRERYKGHDRLIETWPLVRRLVPEARLLIAGDGDDVSRLRAKAGTGIEFLGRVEESRLAALYRDATFFVMPSTDEGFGLVYLEAMGAGTPCIAGRGAAEEIITDGRDGLIVDTCDRDSLVAAMVRLFLEPETRERLGAAARQRVVSDFDRAVLARRVRGMLELGDF